MNIVYGGSFNPPTLAHYAIVGRLKKDFGPENLIIVPVGDGYKKAGLENYHNRYMMLKLMFPNCIISDVEHNKTYQGTLHTLDELSEKYSDLYYVIGADNLLTLEKWIRYEELLRKYHLIVFGRNDIDSAKIIKEKFVKYQNHFHVIDFDIDISSTNIRKNIVESKEGLDEKVYEYIKKNHLYEEVIK